MDQVVRFAQEHSAYLSLSLLAFNIILLLCLAVLSRRISKLAKRKSAKLVGAGAEELADSIMDLSVSVTDLRRRLEEVLHGQKQLGDDVSKCLRRTNIVRFNAFEDVGGEQSFALSLLDENDTGVVISSLLGRHDSRLYAKRVVNGQGERALSEEEQQAIGSRQTKTTVA